MALLAKILAAIVCAVVLLVVAVFAYGREATWVLLAGPADQGPVDFATLTRGPKPNQYILCPPGLCPPGAAADGAAPVFRASVDDLRKALRAVALADPDTALVAETADPPQDRFVQRTALMRWPDTIAVRYVAREDGASTLAVYSRSQIGYRDFEVNAKRVTRWLAAVARTLPPA